MQQLLDLARHADHALDDSEEVQQDGIRSHIVQAQDFHDVVEAIDALNELPDDKPDVTMGPADKAEWALRRLLLTHGAPRRLDDSEREAAENKALAAARGRAKVLRDMLEACIPWVRESIGADQTRIVEIGASLEWPPSVLYAKLVDLVRDFDSEIARELREEGRIV